jgi:hypothetical protein
VLPRDTHGFSSHSLASRQPRLDGIPPLYRPCSTKQPAPGPIQPTEGSRRDVRGAQPAVMPRSVPCSPPPIPWRRFGIRGILLPLCGRCGIQRCYGLAMAMVMSRPLTWDSTTYCIILELSHGAGCTRRGIDPNLVYTPYPSDTTCLSSSDLWPLTEIIASQTLFGSHVQTLYGMSVKSLRGSSDKS